MLRFVSHIYKLAVIYNIIKADKMGMIKCIDCNKEISNQAKACIHCGCPVWKIIDSVIVGDLEIMRKDLEVMNFYDAKIACTEMADTWRLPTLKELDFIFENIEKIGSWENIKFDAYYWSSSISDTGFPWRKNMLHGYNTNGNNGDKFILSNVRLVRNKRVL